MIKMEKLLDYMSKCVDKFKDIIENIENPKIRVITHYDCDGITSGAILSRAFQRADIKFHLTIISQLERKVLESLVKEFENVENGVLFILDLGGDFELIKKIKAKIFILDHHDLKSQLSITQNIFLMHPLYFDNSGKDEICGAGLCYLFSKAVSKDNTDLSSLAIIGMIGDRHETKISRLYQQIITDTNDLEIKKSLLIFSATRPLKKSLEYSTSIYIPGVTGSSLGVQDLLRENNIPCEKTLYELSEEELSKLLTGIMIRRASHGEKDGIIGNIYILKFYNRKEDVRELSVLINACSRLGHSDIALSFCLENQKAKTQI